MLSNTRGSIPMIFFVTDGSVEDERHICDVMKKHLASAGSVFPRIHTFGLGKLFSKVLMLNNPDRFIYLFVFGFFAIFQVYSVITTSCKCLQIYPVASTNQFIIQVKL